MDAQQNGFKPVVHNRLWTSIITNLICRPWKTTLKHSISSKLWALGAEPRKLLNFNLMMLWEHGKESLLVWHVVLSDINVMFSVWRNQISTSIKVVNNCQKLDYSNETIKQACRGIDALISRWAGGSSRIDFPSSDLQQKHLTRS